MKLIENHSYDEVAIHAAKNGMQTCYGRWGKVDGYLFQPDSSDLAELTQYLDDNKSLPDESWPHFQKPNLFPRRLGKKGSSIALGEDCRGKRHFDCIGFIFWVLR